MARRTEASLDGHDSVWNLEQAEPAPESGWRQPLKAWQRWTALLRRPAASAPHEPGRGVVSTQPEAGRGQALRNAHQALRQRMRQQRELRRVLPHLYFIERALAQKGSRSLMEVPVWVLQRGLQQLTRLPADSLAERVQFSVLHHRLLEAIDCRIDEQTGSDSRLQDSFNGSLDSQMSIRGPLSTLSGGLEISEGPLSVFDDLMHEPLPGRPDASASSGGRDRQR